MRNIALEIENPSFNRGLVFILITVITWAVLPLGLKVLVLKMDSITITWARFLVAGVFCLFIQYKLGALSEFKTLSTKDWLILITAAVFLIADYILYVLGLKYISASAGQVFTQATPFFLGLGGVIFFKERITLRQVMFALLLVVGMGLFFYDNITEAVGAEEVIWLGASIIISASFLWSIYALLQKKLQQKIRATNVLLFTYMLALPLMLPFCDFSAFEGFASSDWIIMVLCALNTVVAYSAFAEAMKHWSVVQVSTVLATGPIFTIIASYMAWVLWPENIAPDQISFSGWSGVVLVVVSVIGFNYYQKSVKTDTY